MTNLSAHPHLFIIGEPLTIARAPFTYFCASCTGGMVKVGAAQHERNVRLANIDAVEQQTNVGGLNVPFALFDTVAQGFNADIVALTATGDTILKVDGCLHVRNVFEFQFDSPDPSTTGGQGPIQIKGGGGIVRPSGHARMKGMLSSDFPRGFFRLEWLVNKRSS